MTDATDWLAANDEYLSTGLAWIRGRLEALAPPGPGSPSATASDMDADDSFWSRLTRRNKTHPAPRISGLLAPPHPDPSPGPAQPDAMIQLEQGALPPALVLLGQRLDLSAFERNVLLLAAGMELDTRIAGLCARAQDDPTRPYPTFALALALFDGGSWDALAPDRPLRFWRLLEIHQGPGLPLTASPLRADERIVNYLKGLTHLDDRLSTLVTPLVPEPLRLSLPESHDRLVQKAVETIRQRGPEERLPAIVLAGADGSTRRLIAGRISGALGLHPHQVSAEAVAGFGADAEQMARLWDREAALSPLALYLELPEADAPAPEVASSAVSRFQRNIHSLLFLAGREPRIGDRNALVLDVVHPTPPEQADGWTVLLGETRREDAGRLATQFDLGLPAIQRLVDQASATEAGILFDQIWEHCLRATRPALDRLAQRIDLRAQWDQLVLPQDQTALLRQIVAQVAQRRRVYDEWGFRRRMNRGLGISALFAGESGTGKTMAAEVIAGELKLDLYRIDLSQVVNKYIGETEKNLKRVFDAAEEGGAILLFDEADALFGKRSEVKDSHDRYANIEINYLLQRLEAYRGLAILTTNQKGAMDQAFLRRLRFVVDFPFPGVPDRHRLWELAFPEEAKPVALDHDRLARLALTGGSIHNIALGAAFHAAHAGEPVTMGAVLAAARAEFRKLERPVNETQFRLMDPRKSGSSVGVA